MPPMGSLPLAGACGFWLWQHGKVACAEQMQKTASLSRGSQGGDQVDLSCHAKLLAVLMFELCIGSKCRDPFLKEQVWCTLFLKVLWMSPWDYFWHCYPGCEMYIEKLARCGQEFLVVGNVVLLWRNEVDDALKGNRFDKWLHTLLNAIRGHMKSLKVSI